MPKSPWWPRPSWANGTQLKYRLELLGQSLGKGYLAGEPTEETSCEVEHVDGPRDLGIHVFDADEPADGDDGPVAAEAVA